MVTMEKIVSLAKRRGFVFPGSDIYGGLANTWDYGPLGTELKNNIQKLWWDTFVKSRLDIVGIDAAQLMNPKVWEASGHVENFNDAQVDCKTCKARLRADHLIEEALKDIKVEGLSLEDLDKLIEQNEIKCPKCGAHNFTNARIFNLLFKTTIGPVEKDSSPVFLRGELAQSMFTNFKTVLNCSRKKVPFGIAQVGKVYRNEITPGNFIFRTLEFDLMEFEYFIHPSKWEETFDYWLEEMKKWLDTVGIDSSRTRVREHDQDELSHYSKRTVDIEFNTPFGWKELYGLAYRTDFDLKNHMEKSGQDMNYLDPYTNEKYIPHVIEPTFGLSRTVLMTLLSAYHEEEVGGGEAGEQTAGVHAPTAGGEGTVAGDGDGASGDDGNSGTKLEGKDSPVGKPDIRVVLKLNKKIAPYTVAVLPLVNKLNDEAKKVWDQLSGTYSADFDTTGSIGKRYRRQDEIGTPYCITVDFDTIEKDQSVTVRDRDTMEQERVKIDALQDYLKEKLA